MDIIYLSTDTFHDVADNLVPFGQKFKQTNDYGDFLELTDVTDENKKIYVSHSDLEFRFGEIEK